MNPIKWLRERRAARRQETQLPIPTQPYQYGATPAPWWAAGE